MSSSREQNPSLRAETPELSSAEISDWAIKTAALNTVPRAERPKEFDDQDQAAKWVIDSLHQRGLRLPGFEGIDSSRAWKHVSLEAASRLKREKQIAWPDAPKRLKTSDQALGPVSQVGQVFRSAQQMSAGSDDDLHRHMARELAAQYQKGFADGYAQALANVRVLETRRTVEPGIGAASEAQGSRNIALSHGVDVVSGFREPRGMGDRSENSQERPFMPGRPRHLNAIDLNVSTTQDLSGSPRPRKLRRIGGFLDSSPLGEHGSPAQRENRNRNSARSEDGAFPASFSESPRNGYNEEDFDSVSPALEDDMASEFDEKSDKRIQEEESSPSQVENRASTSRNWKRASLSGDRARLSTEAPTTSSRVTRSMTVLMNNVGPSTSDSATSSRHEIPRQSERMRATSSSSSGTTQSSESWGVEPKESGSIEHKRSYWHARYRDGLNVRECKEFITMEKENESWKLLKVRKVDSWANAHFLTKLEPLASNKKLLAEAKYAISKERELENPGPGWCWVPLDRFKHLARKYKVYVQAVERLIDYHDRNSENWNVPMAKTDNGSKANKGKKSVIVPSCGSCSEQIEEGFVAFQDHLDECEHLEYPSTVDEGWMCSCGATYYDQRHFDDHINASRPPASHKLQTVYP